MEEMELLCEIDFSRLDPMMDSNSAEEEEEEEEDCHETKKNLLFEIFDQNPGVSSPWRSVSPCFHTTKGKRCPWGKNCGFQTLHQTITKEQPLSSERRFFEMLGFRELQYSLEKQYSSQPYPPPPKRQELAPKDLGSPLKLPLKEFLREKKIVLLTEKCQDTLCKGGGEEPGCRRAHYISELFTQFDHPLLIQYFSYHLRRPVQPTIRRGGIFRCSNKCIHHPCQGRLLLAFPFLTTHAIHGSLEGPFVKFQCQFCQNITAFIIYQ